MRKLFANIAASLLLFFAAATMLMAQEQRGTPLPDAGKPIISADEKPQKKNDKKDKEEQPAVINEGEITDKDGKPEEMKTFYDGGDTDREELPPRPRVSVSDVEGLQETIAQAVSNNASHDWLTPGIAVLALLLSAYLLYQKLRDDKKRKQEERNRHHAQKGPSLRDEVKLLQTENQRLSRSVANLSATVSHLDQQVTALRRQPDQHAQPTRDARQHNTSAGNSLRKLYASQVTSEGFPVSSVSESNSDYSVAIISAEGTTGTFVINDLPSAQQYLISNFAYVVGPVCQVAQQAQAPHAVVTQTPGQVSLQGNTWRVTHQAVIRLV